MKYFYCYSLELKNFLKLQNIHYIKEEQHTNGNKCWIFKGTDNLNHYLTIWNDYKVFINNKEQGGIKC